MLKFLSKFFSSNKSSQRPYTRYHPGDFIYTVHEDGYHVSRVLRYEPEYGGVHLSLYNPTSEQPTAQSLDQLEVFVQHVPMRVGGLKDPVHFASAPLTTADFGGYFSYLEGTGQAEYIPWHFLERGNALDELGQHQNAIAVYKECLDRYPSFFQAMDNIAFSNMNMGQWESAIQYFKDSLALEPEGIHATFSLGEALFKSGDKPAAIPYFERALVLKPDLEVAREYLKACGK